MSEADDEKRLRDIRICCENDRVAYKPRTETNTMFLLRTIDDLTARLRDAESVRDAALAQRGEIVKCDRRLTYKTLIAKEAR